MTSRSQDRQKAETRIRAAMDRLLAGDLLGGKCDVQTLASQAGVSRSVLYATYGHLKDEFLQRLAAALAASNNPDPRQHQITRLKDEVHRLRSRLTANAQDVAALQQFRTTAISRLAAQHHEIERLRTRQTRDHNVIPLRKDTAGPSQAQP